MSQDQVARVKQYLLDKPFTIEDYPFGPDVMVPRVKTKMFATLSPGKDSDYYWLNLKCEPTEALMLRDIFPSIMPGYHMNKTHWNTVVLDGSVPMSEIERMIDNSFMLVVNGMKKSDQKSVLLQLNTGQ
ncbi:MAG: MmcQ/YjbR family DNA-binding protein [Kangiellaceae bacterium]|jgi:predicted DNA-binding protein (MmcQ/YjbR family)|nr:MmcQ/YjbR family DNA-binding protein [Kangiellaceae bacterium]